MKKKKISYNYRIIGLLVTLTLFINSCGTSNKTQGVKHSELIGDYGLINPDGEYTEIYISKDKIFPYLKSAGLISSKEYKYINEKLIRMKYRDSLVDKYYDIEIERLKNGTIKCVHRIPIKNSSSDLNTNTEILIPISDNEITLGDFYDINTNWFKKEYENEIYQYFIKRERKNVP